METEQSIGKKLEEILEYMNKLLIEQRNLTREERDALEKMRRKECKVKKLEWDE